ncbi:MAG: phosphate ABC transporter permease PstA, partial [Oscillatoriales cyanobacterium]
MNTPNTPDSHLAEPPANLFQANMASRYRTDGIFQSLTWVSVIIALLVLAALIIDVLADGLPSIDWNFLTSFPSRKAEQAGLLSALAGTIWVMFTVAVVAFPLGVGAGIFLEEFAADNWFTRMIEININNLAGVPSIIYGLLGLQVFVRLLGPNGWVFEQTGIDITGGRSILTGALTLALLVLPIIIVSTREALRSVPDSLRLAGFALGATRWQVVRDQVLPIATPGILTGTILALSRAIGETAPLITIGALTFISFLPENLQSPFTVLPIQIYNWVSRPQKDFHDLAAGGIIVLLVVLLAMNSTAVLLRNKLQ